jgi:hypothetical protein
MLTNLGALASRAPAVVESSMLDVTVPDPRSGRQEAIYGVCTMILQSWTGASAIAGVCKWLSHTYQRTCEVWACLHVSKRK